MATPDVLAKTARTRLAAALNALQNSSDTPVELLELAEPIAQAMGILHRIERSNGADLSGREQVLTNVRGTLDYLQTLTVSHETIDAMMEQIAGCLASVHQLARLAGGAPPAPGSAPGRAAPPVAARPPVVTHPSAAAVVAAVPAVPAPAPAPPQPIAGLAPVQPTSQGVGPSVPEAISAPPAFSPSRSTQAMPAPQPVAPQPVAAAPVPVAVSHTAPIAAAPSGPLGTQVGAPVPFGGTQAIPPAVIAAATAQAPAPAPSPAPQGAGFPPPPNLGAQTIRMQPEPQAPPASAAAPGSSARAPAASAPRSTQSGNVVVELGTHSVSNFYKGLSGNDVIEHGGIFVATYKIPKLGAQVNLRVLLPGDYEFQATGTVQWIREASAAPEGAEPGFGARFTQITPEGRQLVYRYTRNREPMFYDDL